MGYVINEKNISNWKQRFNWEKNFKLFKKKNKVFGLDKHNINLSNENEVKNFFKKNNNFEYLINLHGANEHVVKKNENINPDFLGMI